MAESMAKETVLIVDDNPANIALLCTTLKQEYRTKVANSGEKALAIAAADPPDLILLDIVMPGISGYEACERLKADPRTRSIPVIFVTAMNEVEEEERGLSLGGVDYITKPISPAIVCARVRTHLALARQTRELERWNAELEERVAAGVAQLDRLSRLKRFFSPAVAELILQGNAEDLLKSRRREIVVVFLDLRGFTSFTETADPEDVMQMLGEYHQAMGELITAHGGTLERFGGDSLMIVFNDPVPMENPVVTAVTMAMAMQRRLIPIAQGWRRRGFDLSMGVGVAQGYATLGTIGFEGRRDYGAIGTVTNLAARLCGEAKGGEILVSQRVWGHLDGVAHGEPVGELGLKGFQRPIPAYRILLD